MLLAILLLLLAAGMAFLGLRWFASHHVEDPVSPDSIEEPLTPATTPTSPTPPPTGPQTPVPAEDSVPPVVIIGGEDSDGGDLDGTIVLPDPPSTSTETYPWNVPGPDLDCSDIQQRVPVSPPDYHDLDSDGDGWGCESYP